MYAIVFIHIVSFAMFDEHVSEETKVGIVKNQLILYPLALRRI